MTTAEHLKNRISDLKNKVREKRKADQGNGSEAEFRAVRKKLKRLQRKRRRFLARAGSPAAQESAKKSGGSEKKPEQAQG